MRCKTSLVKGTGLRALNKRDRNDEGHQENLSCMLISLFDSSTISISCPGCVQAKNYSALQVQQITIQIHHFSSTFDSLEFTPFVFKELHNYIIQTSLGSTLLVGEMLKIIGPPGVIKNAFNLTVNSPEQILQIISGSSV